MVKCKFKEIEKNSENQTKEKEDNSELWKRPASKDLKPYSAPRKCWYIVYQPPRGLQKDL